MFSSTSFTFSQEYRNDDYTLPGTITWDSDAGILDTDVVMSDPEPSAFCQQSEYSMLQSNPAEIESMADRCPVDDAIEQLIRLYDSAMESPTDEYSALADCARLLAESTMPASSSSPSWPDADMEDSPFFNSASSSESEVPSDDDALKEIDLSEFILQAFLQPQPSSADSVESPSPTSYTTPNVPTSPSPPFQYSSTSEQVPETSFFSAQPSNSESPLSYSFLFTFPPEHDDGSSSVQHTDDMSVPSSPLPTCAPPSYFQVPSLESSASSSSPPNGVKLEPDDGEHSPTISFSLLQIDDAPRAPSPPHRYASPSHLQVPRISSWSSSRSSSPLSSLSSRVSTPDLYDHSIPSSPGTSVFSNWDSSTPSSPLPGYASDPYLSIPRISSLQSPRSGSPSSSVYSGASPSALDFKSIPVPSLPRRYVRGPYAKYSRQTNAQNTKTKRSRGRPKYTADDDDYLYQSDGAVDYRPRKRFRTGRRRHGEALLERTCSDCGAIFSRVADVFRHKETVHKIMPEVNMENSICKLCNRVLARPDAKKRHEEARPKNCKHTARERVKNGELERSVFEQHFGITLPEDLQVQDSKT